MSDWYERYLADRARRAKREVPMPSFPEHAEYWCRWCGGAITLGQFKRRSWHDGRGDEPNCSFEHALHTRLVDQFAFLVRRDGERCWDCGGSPRRWLRDQYETHVYDPKWRSGEMSVSYIGIRRVSGLEVDHEVPIWSVAHLPDDERRPFFGPTNLRLRCDPCHKAKTRREAGERAALKRAAT